MLSSNHLIQNLTVYNYDATGRPIGMSYRENSYGQYQWDVYWFDLICRAI